MHYIIRYPVSYGSVRPPGIAFIDHCMITTPTHRAVIVPQAALVLPVVDQLCALQADFQCQPIRPFSRLPEATHGYPREGLCSYLYYHVLQSRAPYALLQQEGARPVFIRLLDREYPVAQNQVIVSRETVVIEFIEPARVLVWPE